MSGMSSQQKSHTVSSLCNNERCVCYSGYMSEGGASLYAKRMQQRFREGMAAVKECMQKSSGLVDDDR